MTAAERKAKSRAKLREAGGMQVAVELSADAAAALEKLCSQGLERREAIERALIALVARSTAYVSTGPNVAPSFAG